MDYRLMREEDIPAMLHFTDDQSTVFTPEQLKTFLGQENSQGFVAVQDGTIIGFAYGYVLAKPDGSKTFYVHSVDVMAEYQGKGHGCRLMEEVCDFAEAQGCSKTFLLTGTDNTAAIRCHEKAGGIRSEKAQYVYTFK